MNRRLGLLIVLASVCTLGCQPANTSSPAPQKAPVDPTPAQGAPSKVPESLFGITLGSVQTFKDGEPSAETLPVKQITGADRAGGPGVYYYFRPQKDYPAFRYIESKSSDQRFRASFTFSVLPVFPKGAEAMKEIAPSDLPWEVTRIVWSDNAKDETTAFSWARDYCKTLEVDLGRKPTKSADFPGADIYNCEFQEGTRVLSADAIGKSTVLELVYEQGVLNEKEVAADAMRRKMKMNVERPY